MAFRCYAYDTGHGWHAICTDLDIAVDGGSFYEVKASLAMCVEMYLDSVTELPETERRRFRTRRAPWRIRASLAVSTWLHRIRTINDKRTRVFVLPSQAPAAS